MTGIASKLDSRMFMRVHRSAIVNLKHVKEVRRETSGEVRLFLSPAEVALHNARREFAAGRVERDAFGELGELIDEADGRSPRFKSMLERADARLATPPP